MVTNMSKRLARQLWARISSLSGGSYWMMMENPNYFKEQNPIQHGSWGDSKIYIVVIAVTVVLAGIGILVHYYNKRR